MVESAMALQDIGGQAPRRRRQLLLADLCLARASRLLADTRDEALQVGFATAVQRWRPRRRAARAPSRCATSCSRRWRPRR